MNKKATKPKSMRIFLFAIFAFVFYFFGTSAAHAASLYLSPSSGTYRVGQTFSVGVYVSSPTQAMNAAEGAVAFSSNLLQLTSISRGGSVISLWVQEPSSGGGTASFSGIIYNPGYTGSGGKIITLNFKVKGAGTGTVSFSSGSVLANDGQGTNILSGLGSASFTLLAEEEAVPAEPAKPRAVLPGAPAVSSATHPDPEKWYSNDDTVFNWSLPRGINGVNILADHEADTDPGVASDGVFRSYSYSDVDDGVWYFHIRLRNSQGWGPVSHFRFQIDTKKPDYLHIQQLPGIPKVPGGVSFHIEAKDALSGIDHFEIAVDDLEAEIWQDDGTHIYTTPGLEKRIHTLHVKAIDKAGNFVTISQEFTAPGLLPPQLTNYPRSIEVGELLVVQGRTYADSRTMLFIQKKEDGEPKYEEATSDAEGNFTITYRGLLTQGLYEVWAVVFDEEGRQSGPSEKIKIEVEPPTFFKLGIRASRTLILVVFISFILLLLAAMLFYLWIRFNAIKKKVKKELKEIEVSIHGAFHLLQNDLRKHIKLLKDVKTKRELTREEKKIMDQMKHDIKISEKMIDKEIDNLRKKVK